MIISVSNPEKGSGHIYPLRPSELVRDPERVFSGEIEPIITPEELEQLREFEGPLFEQLHGITDTQVEIHEVYTEAFQEEEGRRLVLLLYKDLGLRTLVEGITEELGILTESIKGKKQVEALYSSLIIDLQTICSSEESFRDYIENGAELPELSKEVGKIVFYKPESQTDQVPQNNEELTTLLYEVELDAIGPRMLEAIKVFSDTIAQKKFTSQLQQRKGDISAVQNPSRIQRVVKPELLAEMATRIRAMKTELKVMQDGLGEEGLEMAKSIVVDLYRRRINERIAFYYQFGSMLEQAGGEEELVALKAVTGRHKPSRSSRKSVPNPRFNTENTPKTLNRIDRFLKGIGIDAQTGDYREITEQTEEKLDEAIEQEGQQSSEAYELYNQELIGPNEVQMLVDLVIRHYGYDQVEKPWSSLIDKSRKTFIVSDRDKVVKIPASLERGLIDVLGVIEHEVTHMIQYQNKANIMSTGLRVNSDIKSGRSSILAEAGAMGIESEARESMVGVTRDAEPYYYIAIREKQRGGTFKDCFMVFLEAYSRRTYGKTIAELIEDSEQYQDAVDYVYERVMRIFRGGVDINDNSGYITNTDQLKYAEQEFLLNAMKENGVEDLAYIHGLDLYSLAELQQLGLIHMDQIQQNDLFLAREVWPEIRRRIDNGVNVSQAIAQVCEEMS